MYRYLNLLYIISIAHNMRIILNGLYFPWLCAIMHNNNVQVLLPLLFCCFSNFWVGITVQINYTTIKFNAIVGRCLLLLAHCLYSFFFLEFVLLILYGRGVYCFSRMFHFARQISYDTQVNRSVIYLIIYTMNTKFLYRKK